MSVVRIHPRERWWSLQRSVDTTSTTSATACTGLSISAARRAARAARFVMRDWDGESELYDLYLCPRHAQAIAKLHDEEPKPERLATAGDQVLDR